ncbi:MAG: M1 family peptidase [Bacteroidetes bacterium]|nr:MAG: M1 family peptidase [Bacteroidota bacterium]
MFKFLLFNCIPIMNTHNTFFVILSSCLIIGACKVNKNSSSTNTPVQNSVNQPASVKAGKKYPYREAEPRVLDIEHMALQVSFNYANQYVLGKATLTCKPYFASIKTAQLDARGFVINRVALLKNADTLPLKYEYNGSKLLVFMGAEYTRGQVFKLFIDYVAKPNEIKGSKGVAITDDKGLYFINPLGNEKDKPRQIWTQGETQSNSCWFPTVDAPNEKITQELAITVEDKEITLSNGELMKSKMNADGTRTDFWKQNKPHAPYLVMLAVGEFEQVKDFWRDSIPVDYYVEKAYKPYAKMVFGNTPEMMEVFSKKLGVDYPWDKYSQIVVRDFVSGAMENTSAVIHYDALQHDAREHLDNPTEDIIAHELFHHWFGDLVTCESWSNLPLNESFATYGEYIWQEHKYGLMEADMEFYSNLRSYLGQKNKHRVEPIRYHYGSRDDMFDVVSYQKGGRMLHMLRKQIGDDAFFESLKLYLTKHAYKTAEIADLRMAFEEVTGEDLHWFFDQWFLKGGHPVLDYSYAYGADRKSVTLTIKQKQDSTWGVYRLPIQVDLYTGSVATRYPITINQVSQEFTFESSGAISFVNVDANQALVAAIDDHKTAAECKAMILNGPLYMDKYYAAKVWGEQLKDTLTNDDINTLNYLLKHEFWGLRNLGISLLEQLDSVNRKPFEPTLFNIARMDKKSANRADATTLLAETDAKKYTSVFEQGIQDSAYSVVAASLEALNLADSTLGKKYVNANKETKSGTVQLAVARILAEYPSVDEVAYFESKFNLKGYYKYSLFAEYIKYLQLTDKAIQLKAIPGLKKFYQTTNDETRALER